MTDYTIGIDPDIKRDGLAIVHVATRRVTVMETTFGHTIAELQRMHIDCLATRKTMKVYIEGGWLNKGNYHLTPKDTKYSAASKGVDQGRNHQRGLDIVEWCEYQKIPYEVIKPLRKVSSGFHLWSGPDGKITQKEIEAFMGPLRTRGVDGKVKRINQEARDAALIAWTMAGLPIKV